MSKSTTTVYHCDFCKTKIEMNLYGPIIVEMRSLIENFSNSETNYLERHFCSWSCLSKWATAAERGKFLKSGEDK